MEILSCISLFWHHQVPMVALPTEQRCCSGSRLSADRSLMDGVSCARFACCVTGHRTAQKTFPPQKGSSDQEELYQEVALPSPAQMLACHTPMTLQLCLL